MYNLTVKAMPELMRLDYRNAKFQGCVCPHSILNGIGLLIDDDMGAFFSQWSQNQMDGHTFASNLRSEFIYGILSGSKPSGPIIVHNKTYLLIIQYLEGVPRCDTKIVVVTANNKYAVIMRKVDTNYQVDEFITLNQDILLNKLAEKANITLPEYFSTPKTFLHHIMKVHQAYDLILEPKRNDGKQVQYCGFINGLGITFKQGAACQNFSVLSMGKYDSKKIREYGGFVHSKRCVEEGNFLSKETISYDPHQERPRAKINQIFKKIHQKSMNFINSYFQRPAFLRQVYQMTNLLAFDKVINECLSMEPQKKRTPRPQLEEEYYQEIRKQLRLKDSDSPLLQNKANSGQQMYFCKSQSKNQKKTYSPLKEQKKKVDTNLPTTSKSLPKTYSGHHKKCPCKAPATCKRCMQVAYEKNNKKLNNKNISAKKTGMRNTDAKDQQMQKQYHNQQKIRMELLGGSNVSIEEKRYLKSINKLEREIEEQIRLDHQELCEEGKRQNFLLEEARRQCLMLDEIKRESSLRSEARRAEVLRDMEEAWARTKVQRDNARINMAFSNRKILQNQPMETKQKDYGVDQKAKVIIGLQAKRAHILEGFRKMNDRHFLENGANYAGIQRKHYQVSSVPPEKPQLCNSSHTYDVITPFRSRDPSHYEYYFDE